MTSRLLKGTLVFVQGELSTSEYDRAIERQESVEHTIQQIAVELKPTPSAFSIMPQS